MSTVPNDVDEIRRQMAKVRREMHQDVAGVVATAEAATDWKKYITAYPWAVLGAAFVAGYLIVPKRDRSAVELAGVATQADLAKVREAVEEARRDVVETATGKGKKAAETRKKSLIGAALAMAAPLAWRAVQGYGMKYLEQWIMQQQMQNLQAGPQPAPGPGPSASRPGGPGAAGGPRRPAGPWPA